MLPNKRSVCELPIPALAGPGTPELGLHSIHSYGYASHSSPALVLVYWQCLSSHCDYAQHKRSRGIPPHLSLVLRRVAVCASIRDPGEKCRLFFRHNDNHHRTMHFRMQGYCDFMLTNCLQRSLGKMNLGSL